MPYTNCSIIAPDTWATQSLVAPSTQWTSTRGHTLASGKALSKAYLLAASAAPPTNTVRQQCPVTSLNGPEGHPSIS